MEAMQLFRVCLVAFPHTRGILRIETLAAHHGFPLDVVPGSQKVGPLRAFGTEERMVEGTVPQVLVRGTSETRRQRCLEVLSR